MKRLNKIFTSFFSKLFSTTEKIQRSLVWTVILFVVVVGGFAGYYYYDRYYRPQPKAVEVSLAQAEKAVRDDPQSTKARLALAETYMLNRRWDDAQKAATQVLSVEPDNQHAWLVVGVCGANNGQAGNAIEPLTKFVDARKGEDMPGLDPQLQAAAYYLGDSYLQLGKPQEAIAPLEMAVNWSQTDADAMYKLGVAYAGVKDYEKALNMFHAATTFVPDFQDAYQKMAETYDVLNKPELANFARGMLAYAQKDYPTARDLLLKSVQAKPDFAPTYAGLGRIYEALEDLPNAKAAYESALKIDINNFTASNGLQRVEALMKK
jgi:tetratricopeptide (TPR) repeat protein